MSKPWRKAITRREFLGGALAGAGALAAACAPNPTGRPTGSGRPGAADPASGALAVKLRSGAG